MDLRKLKTLIDLVSESNVAELEITEPEGKVRIVKSTGVQYTPAPGYSNPVPHGITSIDLNAPAPAVAPSQQEGAGQASVPSSALAPAPTPSAAHVVKSPMVGTFYRSASPESAAFVEVGSVVKEGETICIIEAMKILNEIEADKSGTITKIHAQNAQAVEYGSALFDIE
jgi:acetyl-CoA carboxylase biotin carboxyl carrier protein